MHLVEEALKVSRNRRPGGLVEGGAKPVRARGASSVKREDRGADLRPGEGRHQRRTIDRRRAGVQGRQVEPPGGAGGPAQQVGVEPPQRRLLGAVINQLNVVDRKHPDGVPPTPLRRPGMEVSGVLVTFRNGPALPPLSPVGGLPRHRASRRKAGITP